MPDRYLFELTGGHLCLDLANTLDDRKTDHPRELLRSYQDLLDWGTQAGAIAAAESAAVRRYAGRYPRAAQTALTRVRGLREVIFEVFVAAAAGRPIPAPALTELNRFVSKILGVRRLERRSIGCSWGWRRAEPSELERVAWPAAWSAAELLTSADLDRVRVCAGAGCAWLFIDTSRNRTRRWCDMSVCGNRAKARRHYRKISRQ